MGAHSLRGPEIRPKKAKARFRSVACMVACGPRIVADVFGAHCARGGTRCGLFYKVTKIVEVSWDCNTDRGRVDVEHGAPQQ